MAREICISLGERIRDLRKERGWRQIDLSVQAHISENYVSDLEIGKKEIGLRTLQAVALALGVKTSDLLKDLD
jgi:transcriptional regulator with XRE-family HTH domain